jgi:hypothetical protein
MSEVAYEMLPIRRAIPNPMIVGKSMPMTATDDVESQLYSRREAFFTQDWLFRSDTGTDIFGMCCIARSDNQGIHVRRLDELSADSSAFCAGNLRRNHFSTFRIDSGDAGDFRT